MPRRKLDFYETPPHYVAALLGEVNVQGTVFEPCAGEGAISDALRTVSVVKRVVTNDIDKQRDTDHNLDARMPLTWTGMSRYDWVITNPPFSDELEILEQAFDSGIKNIAFLARLSFLEPTEDREYFLEQHAPHQVIVLPRYSFRPNDAGKKQTDSVTCCWMVWHQDGAPRRLSAWGRGKSTAYAALRGLHD